MYPAIACTRIIPVQKIIPVCFNESDGVADNHTHRKPFVNIGKTHTGYIIAIAAPGLNRENFQIEIENSVLTISAQKEKVITRYKIDRCEFNYSAWTRAFQMPADSDSMLAQADYLHGELTIHIPRSDSNENIVKARIHVY